MKEILAFTIAVGLAAPVFAQDFPVHEQTGSVEISFGGEQFTHYTTANTVPGQPDRQVHTASWLILEPMLLGGINLSPDDVFMVVSSRDAIDPGAGQTELRAEFSLHPETLELKTDPAPTIHFHPADSGDHYTLTSGSLEIHDVRRIDATTLAFTATAQGKMSRQTGDSIDADDTKEFSASFDLYRAVNRGAVQLP